MLLNKVKVKMRACGRKTNVWEHDKRENQTAPQIPIAVNGKRDRAKTESLRRQLFVAIDMDLMHGADTVERYARNGVAPFPRKAPVEFMVEMVM